MKIKYIRDGRRYSNFDTCRDFELEVTKKAGKTSATVIAKRDIELIEAVDLLPIPTNTHDLYFLNGYQSWTDT